MEWTTERRYRRYEDWTEEEKQAVSKNMATSPWHTHYHVEPKSGLLNDPNGFSYFDGKWILFYQNFPFGAAHGLKSWVQTERQDSIATELIPDLPCSLVINYSYSILEMFVMQNGFAIPTKSER